MQKVIYRIGILWLAMPMLFSCKKELERLNINPNTVGAISPGVLFSGILVGTSSNQVTSQTGFYNMDMLARTCYCHAFMQYGYTSNWAGTTYLLDDGVNTSYWNSFYGTVIKNMEYLLPQIRNNPAQVNTYAAARIWRVFLYQKVTDFFGDVPYSQAGKAFSDNIYNPVYDPQQQIYDSLIAELKMAVALFNPAAANVAGDQFYGGNIDQWKRLGNSLLLRIGMRLIKVDPARAALLVNDAVNSGVMQSLADMPVLKHTVNAPNGFSFNLQDQHFLLHSTLVNYLKQTQDPRLAIYGAIYDRPNGSVLFTDTARYTGYSSSLPDSVANVRVTYSIFQPEATPFFDFHYAQVEFLLAEAILRGFIPGDAADHYQKGVRAHMQSLAQLPGSPTITEAQMAQYLAANPLVLPANPGVEAQIERINTAFWVAAFLFDADEEWANWRRTGYPRLSPNPHTLSGPSSSPGVIPRKAAYPQSEFNNNNPQVTRALQAYGGLNNFQARVWWDKP